MLDKYNILHIWLIYKKMDTNIGENGLFQKFFQTNMELNTTSCIITN